MKRIGSLAESGYCNGLENRSQPKGCIGSNPIASANLSQLPGCMAER